MTATATSLKLAAISMTTSADKERNIREAERLVREAAQAGADWVQLPEMFPFMGDYAFIHDMAELQGGALFTKMAGWAKELGIVLFAGTVGERPKDYEPLDFERKNELGQRKVFNTSYVFGRSGELLAKYRKIHLFNLNGDDGRPRYCESDGFIPGEEPVSVMIDGLKVALSICYDLRFPALYQLLSKSGDPDVITVPSAFTKGTGIAHWELLLRARAVEHQSYVFAANQTGEHSPGKESFGHALVIDPWGTVLADTGDQPGIAMATITAAGLKDVRARLPALANRRPDIYHAPR